MTLEPSQSPLLGFIAMGHRADDDSHFSPALVPVLAHNAQEALDLASDGQSDFEPIGTLTQAQLQDELDKCSRYRETFKPQEPLHVVAGYDDSGDQIKSLTSVHAAHTTEQALSDALIACPDLRIVGCLREEDLLQVMASLNHLRS